MNITNIRNKHKILLEKMKIDNKPFCQFVKSQTKENFEVSPLQNDEGTLASDSREKAAILNRQFKSMFIQDDGNEIS